MQANRNRLLMIALAVTLLFSLLISAFIPMHIHVYDHTHAHEHNTEHYSKAHPVHDTSHKKYGHNINTVELNALIDWQLSSSVHMQIIKAFILTTFVLLAVIILPLKIKLYTPYVPIFLRWKTSSPPPLRAPPFQP